MGKAMRRRSRAGSERAKSHRHKAKPRRRSAPESVSQETDLARRTRERDEAVAQQAVTGEILKLISSSTFDLQAVLDRLVNSAVRLCDADTGVIRRREGD